MPLLGDLTPNAQARRYLAAIDAGEDIDPTEIIDLVSDDDRPIRASFANRLWEAIGYLGRESVQSEMAQWAK